MKKKLVIVSGYFNPLHKGHLEYFIAAKSLGDFLYVIVNSDYQRALKGSKQFQDQEERLMIVRHIKEVDFAMISIDKDRSVCKTLTHLHDKYSNTYDLVFANGGDQNNAFIPEQSICKSLNIELVDGLGNKIQSSSWLLNQ